GRRRARGSPSWRCGATGLAQTPPSAPLQLLDQPIDLVARDVPAPGIINEHRGGALANADALRELDRNLAVRRRRARLHLELRAHIGKHLVALAQLAGEPAADPQ